MRNDFLEQRDRIAALVGLPSDAPRLDEALTHPSYSNERRDLPDNQRLDNPLLGERRQKHGVIAHGLPRLVGSGIQQFEGLDPPDRLAGGGGQRLHFVRVVARTQRLWQSAPPNYESVVALFYASATKAIVQRQ